MDSLLEKYFSVKSEIASKTLEFRTLLERDQDYVGLADDLKLSHEALRSYRVKLSKESPDIQAVDYELKKLRASRKELIAAIKDSIKVVNKDTGETLQYSFNFTF